MSALRSAAVEALEQMISLIRTARQASGPSDNLYVDSGLGGHVRHVADHFRAFETGLVTGFIDYNQRRRESELERNASLGLAELQDLQERLQYVDVSFQPVTVESEVSCLQQVSRRCESTYDRELVYLIYHTIHHVAYAALLMKQIGLTPDTMVGNAPATATYLRQNDAITI